MVYSDSSQATSTVSIVIPCYNQGEFLLEAIASVAACPDAIYDLVIVNDGSTDSRTIEILQSLEEQGYRILHQENQGLSSARNYGIEKTTGCYILPLDADNKIRPEYLARGIEILDQFPEVGVVYGHPAWFGEPGRSWEMPEQFDADRLLEGNYIDACAVIRRTLWESCGGYDTHLPIQCWEDWDFWLSAIEKGWKFHYVPEVLFDYRVRAGSMITACSDPDNLAQLLEYIYAKHRDLYRDRFPKMIGQRERQIAQLWQVVGDLKQTVSRLETELQAESHRLAQTNSRISELEGSVLAMTDARVQLQQALEQKHIELVAAQGTIAAMESSKFWKLREQWLRLKKRLGFSAAS